MVRIIYPADIVLPRGDSGYVQIKVPYFTDEDDIALFVVWDKHHPHHPVWQQIAYLEDGIVTLTFGKDIAWALMPGRYNWDVKIYHNPEYNEEGCVIGAETTDSLYGAYRLPKLLITEV